MVHEYPEKINYFGVYPGSTDHRSGIVLEFWRVSRKSEVRADIMPKSHPQTGSAQLGRKRHTQNCISELRALLENHVALRTRYIETLARFPKPDAERLNETPEGLAFLAVDQPFYLPWRASWGEKMSPAQEMAKAFRDDFERVLQRLREFFTLHDQIDQLLLFPLLGPIPQLLRAQDLLPALDTHIRLLNRELPAVRHVSLAERGVRVPSNFPARLGAARGSRSWSWVAQELKLDPKTVMKLRNPGSVVDSDTLDCAQSFVDSYEASNPSK